MAKKGASAHMTTLERILGGILFVFYLFVLPFVGDALFSALSRLIGVGISGDLRNMVLYITLFVLTLLIFWRYLGNTTGYFFSNLWKTLGSVSAALVGFYGLNTLVCRVLGLFLSGVVDLSDVIISAQTRDAPSASMFLIIFLAPFVEEVLFRSYVFGNLRPVHRTVAYIVSCLLFAVLHIWQFALGPHDIVHFLLMVQYLVPGFLFAWCYERSGTLWGSVLLHAAVNALALLA